MAFVLVVEGWAGNEPVVFGPFLTRELAIHYLQREIPAMDGGFLQWTGADIDICEVHSPESAAYYNEESGK